jgi:hypothetical protein
MRKQFVEIKTAEGVMEVLLTHPEENSQLREFQFCDARDSKHSSLAP